MDMEKKKSVKDEFDVRIECVGCGSIVEAPETMLKFAVCKCSNQARICRENMAHGSHLLGGQDDLKTFVHVYSNQQSAAKFSLKTWNHYQHQFKTAGTLTQLTKLNKKTE